jgi:sucrose-phosphate synthase
VEAAACGLPVIASPTGGPKEIVESCNNGLLVDVEDPSAIATALKRIVSDQNVWELFSTNGIKETLQNYSWPAYAEKYIGLLDELFDRKKHKARIFIHKTAYAKKLSAAKLFVVCDIDGTLIDGSNAEGLDALKKWLLDKQDVVFGVASGRNRQLTEAALVHHDLQADIMICSAGVEIFYTDKYILDHGYERYINYQWKREELTNVLASFKSLRLQEQAAQWPFKISYYADADFNVEDLTALYKILDEKELRAKILLTENKYVDIIPFRAGKGNALRFLSNKWNLPIENFITAGNSGNDIDMLKGKTKGIVVANYSPELEPLKKNKEIYFAKHPLAAGVLEGIEHYTIQMEDALT